MTSATSGSTNSANTVTRLHIPSPLPLRARDLSPAGSYRDIMPSTDFVVPSPSNDVFVPPNSLGHYDIPPPSPPPTVPLPDVPTNPEQWRGRGQGSEAGHQPHLTVVPSIRSSSPSNPPQRGRVSPFPTRPVQSNGIATVHAVPSRGFESRPSDSEDDPGSDADLRNVIQGFTDGGRSASATGHERDVEPEAALDRRRSLEALQNYYNSYDIGSTRKKSPTRQISPRPSFSRSASEEDLSDDRSRYTSDDKHSMYKTNNASQARSLASGWADDHRWSMSVDGESRASFMDAEKSDEARERFIRRIEGMFDQNGRELPPNLGTGRNAIIPPVPKLPQGLQGSSSKTWI
ncbi:hypothetical protein HHX47_DHR2000749 [Lentinula edodes]|nr:hypothetical protein HHX47_DHR2000749 [Lentinula edodes]